MKHFKRSLRGTWKGKVMNSIKGWKIKQQLFIEQMFVLGFEGEKKDEKEKRFFLP